MQGYSCHAESRSSQTLSGTLSIEGACTEEVELVERMHHQGGLTSNSRSSKLAMTTGKLGHDTSRSETSGSDGSDGCHIAGENSMDASQLASHSIFRPVAAHEEAQPAVSHRTHRHQRPRPRHRERHVMPARSGCSSPSAGDTTLPK